ncbi:MAG: histidine--tRNA ligase [Gammaproteobacteria bacterium]|nr:histidine--tRNA ligase [Gammaproteobacteria bacterium]
MSAIQSIKGMNDILPDAAAAWQRMENIIARVFASYAYREIRLPIMERTGLFSRSIGQETDIVGKEMYTFEDRNGESVTLRPEATASCVRAGLENGLFHNQQQRLWYMGPMFRHERPQRGRYRQFHQAGAEAVGWPGPDIDAELIALSRRLWRELDIPMPRLEINSLGEAEARGRYREKLVEYLEQYRDELDPDSQRRLATNPLRILDSKNERTREILREGPELAGYLDRDSAAHFEALLDLLEGMGIEYSVSPRLVRGLDYYSRTVFEWVGEGLGAQATICAGGRYDGLVELLGGKPSPAIGFAMGLERLVESARFEWSKPAPQVFVVAAGEAALRQAMGLAERLRDAGWETQMHCGDAGMKSQMRKADRSGARVAAIIGEDESAGRRVTVKSLRADVAQTTVDAGDAVDTIAGLLVRNDDGARAPQHKQ